jgi:Flp pilus assembly protein TadD
MRSSFAFFVLLIFSFYLVFGGSPSVRNSSAHDVAEQSAFDKREAAYRANNLGVALLEQYKAKEASETFTRALVLKPDLLIARINLSIALYYLPDAEGAKREAQKALTQDENAPQPHYLLGLIARSQNRFEEAVAGFQKVLKGDPADVGANINVGQILVQQKKHDEAISAFRRAIEAEPYNETALYNLGLLLTRTGKRDEGQRLIRRFQQLKQSGAGTALGTNYLESGHYAEAVVSTGAERDLVDRATPDAKFVKGNGAGLPAIANPMQKTEILGRVFRQSDFEDLVKSEAGQRYLVAGLGGSAVLFDYDGDGPLDLFFVTPTDQHLYRNERGRFVEITKDAGALAEKVKGVGISAVAGDYDNDGKPDLFVFRFGNLSLYHNDGKGKFSDVTVASGIPVYPFLTCSVAFVDVDHDGDLDIFIAGLADLSKPPPGGEVKVVVFPSSLAGAPNMLLRNNGNGRFTDITSTAKVGSVGHAVAVVPTDFDNRRDVDLLVVNYDTAPDLFSNQRDGSFRNVAREAGLDTPPGWNCVSVSSGDVNKDGFTDLFIARATGPGLWATSDGKRHFKLGAAPSGFKGSSAAQFIDYDNDGLLDLVTVSARGLQVSRNLGDGWMEVTDQAVARELRQGADDHDGALRLSLASGDLDGDGDTDLILRGPGGLIFARNDGGNRNHSVRVNLKGRVSNRSAIEAKVEMRAGSLWQKLETYSASPAPAPADLIFGLGKREAPDAVRVLWPAGIVQAETEFPASAGGRLRLDITELDRKPSSCPYLYAWNGERFEFVTDFMGGGEMGYLEEPGRYNKPDPEEYVRIRGDQLNEKDGRYELRVTNELEEAMFVDRLQLLVVTHPVDTQVYPNEGMTEPPKPFKLFVTQNAQPPLGAIDDHGKDVLDLISRLDRRWPDDFRVGRIRGYAEEHALTLRLTDAGSADVPSAPARRSLTEKNKEPGTERLSLSAHLGGRAANAKRRARINSRSVLLLTGWTDYAWSSDNVAAAQAGKAMKPPALQVRDAKGNWRTVVDDIGIPVGRPQTVTVDLTNKFLSANREVRIVTNMRVYWDQILFDSSGGDAPAQIARLDPARADLKWRGFSAELTPDNREPFGYDYARVSFTSPWKVMTGRYTREGDVRELLLQSDDMFAICRPGDEISLSFDARTLGPLPAGWTRTFLLYSDGFSKEMDINSASPDQVAPLPFHGMSRYPYAWPEHYPLTEARERYIEKYNTRVVTSPVPLIESFILQR